MRPAGGARAGARAAWLRSGARTAPRAPKAARRRAAAAGAGRRGAQTSPGGPRTPPSRPNEIPGEGRTWPRPQSSSGAPPLPSGSPPPPPTPRTAGAGSLSKDAGRHRPPDPGVASADPAGPPGGGAGRAPAVRRRTRAVPRVGDRAGAGTSPSPLGAASEITPVYLRSQSSSLINYRASALVYSFCAGEKRIIYGPPNWV